MLNIESFIDSISSELDVLNETIVEAQKAEAIIEAARPKVEAIIPTPAKPAATVAAATSLISKDGDLRAIRNDLPGEAKEDMIKAIAAAFDARRAYELSKPSMSSKMMPLLEAEQRRMSSPGIISVMLACEVDPSFINTEVSTGNRYNIYAVQKFNDLAAGLDAGFVSNAINKAIIGSMFNFKDAGVAFTSTAALGATSDKVKVDAHLRKHLISHTVSAATAPTQKSSTMSALRTLGIVENLGSRSSEIWALTDTPQTRRLEEMFRPAA